MEEGLAPAQSSPTGVDAMRIGFRVICGARFDHIQPQIKGVEETHYQAKFDAGLLASKVLTQSRETPARSGISAWVKPSASQANARDCRPHA